MIIANTIYLDFIVNSSDKVIGKSTFVDKTPFDSTILNDAFHHLYKFRTKQIKSIVDIGANIGTIGLTAVASKMVQNCIAFEPDLRNFSLLKSNIVLNHLQESVSAYNVALSNGKSNKMELEIDSLNFGDSRLRVGNNQGLFNESSRNTIKVQVKKLDDYINEIKPNDSLIFIDTQVSEGLILKGASNFLKFGIPIVSEFWPYGLSRINCFEDFLDAIDNGMYKHFILLEKNPLHYSFSRDAIIELYKKLTFTEGSTNILFF